MSLDLIDVTIRNSTDKILFSSLSLKVQAGEVVSIMGPSGCGKSTLLHLIAGHLPEKFSYQGEVTLYQNKLTNLPPHLRQIGILFQDDLLFPHLNVWQNLAFALPNTIKGKSRQQQALQALESIDLLMLANHFPEQLSGGQRARISLIRMLLAKPKAVLLDEPFSKLDKTLRTEFRGWVFQQLQQANVPTLMVTHDEEDIPSGSQCLHWPWNVT